MPISTPCWKTPDGQTHTNYLSALKHELTLFLVKGFDAAKIKEMNKIIDQMTEEQIVWMHDHLGKMASELKNPTKFCVASIAADGATVVEQAIETPPDDATTNVVKMDAGAPAGEPKTFVDASVADQEAAA